RRCAFGGTRGWIDPAFQLLPRDSAGPDGLWSFPGAHPSIRLPVGSSDAGALRAAPRAPGLIAPSSKGIRPAGGHASGRFKTLKQEEGTTHEIQVDRLGSGSPGTRTSGRG